MLRRKFAIRALRAVYALSALCLGAVTASADERCGGDYVCIPHGSESNTTWSAGRAAQVRSELANFPARERCAEALVDVTAPSPEEWRLVCAATDDALQLLGRCAISLRRPLHVQIVSEVRHPFSRGVIFGFFDTNQEKV